MLTAKEIQELIGAEDLETLVHGCTFGRNTLNVYFENGKLCRIEEDLSKVVKHETSDTFDPDFFFHDVKRWYIGKEEKGINRKLREMFETFGRPLPTTPGGFYP